MISFTFNGLTLLAPEGQSVAAALISHQESITRYTRHQGKARGVFCGIGICFDCLLVIDGQPNQRACLSALREGMVIEVQYGS